MKTYTHASLSEGAGVFDHLMRMESTLPSAHTEMPVQVAVGFIAAAIKGGLSQTHLWQLIDRSFDAKTADLLKAVRDMYDGSDARLHLWQWHSDDRYELHYPLRCLASPRWSIDQFALAYST